MSCRIAILGTLRNDATAELVSAWAGAGLDVEAMEPDRALAELRPGDVALGRLDVCPELDGVEPGLAALLALPERGVRVINGARALVTVHDKLRTARALAAAGVPHPPAVAVRCAGRVDIPPPLVVKPRFGSWGKAVYWCETAADLERTLAAVGQTTWFRRHGALVQAAVPPVGYDLRIVVAEGRVVGCGRRLAAPGEWRTNVSLGGTLEPAPLPDAAAALALAAAAAVGTGLVGVDLLPVDGGYVVLELNGAVEYDQACALADTDIHLDVAQALGLLPDAAGLVVQLSARAPE